MKRSPFFYPGLQLSSAAVQPAAICSEHENMRPWPKYFLHKRTRNYKDDSIVCLLTLSSHLLQSEDDGWGLSASAHFMFATLHDFSFVGKIAGFHSNRRIFGIVSAPLNNKYPRLFCLNSIVLETIYTNKDCRLTVIM